MIILIAGASHTGKTLFAQKLLEKYKYPYLSVDHLKMGLIRAGYTNLTPMSDDNELTAYLWPVIREMIKTAIENKQNLIIEGCYIPFDYKNDFEPEYLENIEYYCLVMSEKYVRNHFDDIKKYANTIEDRLADDYTLEESLKDNSQIFELAKKHKVNYILIDNEYEVDDYKAEARSRWSETEAYKEHTEKTKDYSKDNWQCLVDGMNDIFAEFARCKDSGLMPDSNEAQALTKRLQNYITDNYYTCTNDVFAGLGRMYVLDERFKNNIDTNSEDTAEFVKKAIEFYCKNN